MHVTTNSISRMIGTTNVIYDVVMVYDRRMISIVFINDVMHINAGLAKYEI